MLPSCREIFATTVVVMFAMFWDFGEDVFYASKNAAKEKDQAFHLMQLLVSILGCESVEPFRSIYYIVKC